MAATTTTTSTTTTLEPSSATPLLASRSCETPDDYEHVPAGPPRHASWVLVSWLQLGSTIGAGVLSMSSAFAGLGWAMASVFAVACCILNAYCAMQLFEASKLVPEAHGIVLLSKLAVPSALYNSFVDFLQHLYLGLTNAAFVLLMSNTLQYVFFDVLSLCRFSWGVVGCLVVLPLMQLRNLASLRWLLWFNLLTFYGAVILVMLDFLQHPGPSSASTHVVPPDLSWVDVFNSLSKFSFSYMNTHLTLQFLSEMRSPANFTRSIALSVPMQLVTYFSIGGFGYSHLGKTGNDLLVLYMTRNANFRIASGMLFVHFVVSFLIQGQVLARLLHAKLRPSTLNKTSFRGTFDWFLVTLGIVLTTLLIANAIPVFDQIVSLIGSLTVCLAYVFPLVGTIFARRLNKLRTSTSQQIVYGFIFFYAAVLFVGGLAAVIVTIAKAPSSDAGPFTCASHIPAPAQEF